MSDTASTAVETAKELGKVAANATVIAVVEVTATVAVLSAASFVANKLQARRAKKNLAV